jgi:hypothetical protein
MVKKKFDSANISKRKKYSSEFLQGEWWRSRTSFVRCRAKRQVTEESGNGRWAEQDDQPVSSHWVGARIN